MGIDHVERLHRIDVAAREVLLAAQRWYAAKATAKAAYRAREECEVEVATDYQDAPCWRQGELDTSREEIRPLPVSRMCGPCRRNALRMVEVHRARARFGGLSRTLMCAVERLLDAQDAVRGGEV